MEDYSLTSTLIPGTITYEEGERQATIDLCLVTVGLADRVIRSEVDRDFDHDSDHLPVVTSFDLSVKQLSREPRKNWKSIDEKKFKSVVLRNLPPLRRPRTRSALDQYAGEIVAALQNAIETAVPQRIWSPKARRGWDEECTRVLAEAKRLRRLHNLYHTDETWEAYRKARNHKGRVIKKALRRGHRENVERASESPEALWKMARWARNRNAPAPEVTPALQHPDTLQMTSDTAEKADIFRRAFFPCPPEADISDIEGAVYPERIDMPAITEQEVERAIREASPLKAPGPDSIPNKALHGDLSIKTASAGDMEALRQFAEDWEHRLGNGATVRIPTYGVLVHGIRTNSMDVSRFEDIRDDILQENRPFIPNAGIKYIGWLTRTSAAKTASSVIIEFTRSQDANKIIDEGLIWQGEMTKTISALCSLGGSTWGLTFQDMRKIYKGVVVPQIMYACSAWSNANWRTRNMPYTNKTLVNLQSLQARAARLISGAFKATSTPALDIETHLLPIEHQIWKHNIECLGRIGLGEQDLREEEPQHGANGQRIRKTRMSPRKAIQKAIQDEQGFNIKRLEVITPHVVPPWWTSPKTFIEESAEKAQERHQYSIDNEPSAIHIYTDGSGINGHVGAAAVCTTTSQIKSAYMGDDAVSTVYAGELQGISLALQIAQEDRNRGNIRNKVLIYTDNQAAIRGAHEAWSKQCATRKDEMAKVKAAYATRPRYHLVPQGNATINQTNPSMSTQEKAVGNNAREGVPSLAPSCVQHNRQGRSRSPTKRGQKRAISGSNLASLDDVENEATVSTGSRRPQRTITPSRRALEALDTNSARLHGSYQAENMDVDNRE
ncbi:hypothetical protein H634G_11258 [Metarhizium anisopliae BRIP 53293]|uniref:RNase H type-1 domain-containing protein n=1 Tax=Metarhizium anisopliae BRIP 53293 TaxID=1291518 RepID=A0A0D9NHT1_METAN|nr:hypothetical protein H634G_11258 [Metarhizium anisopliae BRIP 53293]